MSGGFFRGTSADQDTRFSNKQAKLLKSQKFAPELEHLVDMSKVKMDVMRPWIAHRVTELLGFEDEVLINFIYGLLDVKEVNGKEIQISLTGFMEKNTGKFMKELWTLLLSAQKNASGVPQQFLDAKEEETRKKKAETDRITNEIQKKKEKEAREREEEKIKKMDGEADSSRANRTDLEPSSRHPPRASSLHSADDKENNERNGLRGRSRVSRSPHSAERSLSSPRGTRSRSISKSFSNSRSYSDERRRSRSISGPPQPRGRSMSSERVSHSPPRRSVTPRRRDSPQRSPSPLRRRFSHFRRRSMSRSRRRSPTPLRRRLHSPIRRRSRSPMRRRSRSPMRRRSPSPVQRRSRSRSPMRRRSRSPMRYRSPVRRRSRSPLWRRSLSPGRGRSPSPGRRRSPSPIRRRYRRSPSTPRRRSPSPIRRRSPFPIRHRPIYAGRRRSPTPGRRSPSPQEWSSQSPVRHMPPSPVRRRSPKKQRRSPMESPRDRNRTYEKFSPVSHGPPKEKVEHSVETRKRTGSLERRPLVSARSAERDLRDRNDSRRKVPALSTSPFKSPSDSESPPAAKIRSPIEDRRSSSPYERPVTQTRERVSYADSPSPPRKPREHKPIPRSPDRSIEEEGTNHARGDEDQKKSLGKRSKIADECKDSVEKVHYKVGYSPERLASRRSGETQSRTDDMELEKKDQDSKSEAKSGRVPYPEVSKQELPTPNKGNLSTGRLRESYSGEGYKADKKSLSHLNDVKGSVQGRELEIVSKLSTKVERNDRSASVESGSEDDNKRRAEVKEKRKQKKSKRHEVTSDDDYSYDSEIEERKDAKRRRKEEKRSKKEERRRRREERRRRREERRAEKLKLKSVGSVTPPDIEKNYDGYASAGEHVTRKGLRANDVKEAESEQKRLEIELREKALESLRAKKGGGH